MGTTVLVASMRDAGQAFQDRRSPKRMKNGQKPSALRKSSRNHEEKIILNQYETRTVSFFDIFEIHDFWFLPRWRQNVPPL